MQYKKTALESGWVLAFLIQEGHCVFYTLQIYNILPLNYYICAYYFNMFLNIKLVWQEHFIRLTRFWFLAEHYL